MKLRKQYYKLLEGNDMNYSELDVDGIVEEVDQAFEQTSNEPKKRFPLMDTPFSVKNFTLFSRDELRER